MPVYIIFSKSLHDDDDDDGHLVTTWRPHGCPGGCLGGVWRGVGGIVLFSTFGYRQYLKGSKISYVISAESALFTMPRFLL